LHITSLIILLCAYLTFQNNETAESILVGLFVCIAVWIYWTAINIFIGVKRLDFHDDVSLHKVWQSRVSEMIGMVSLYLTGHLSLFFFALPASIIILGVDSFATLLQLNILSMDDDEVDEDEDA